MLKNKVIYILDDSGSMRKLRESALAVFNEIVSQNKLANERAKQRTETSIALFSGPYQFRYLQEDVNIKGVRKVSDFQYQANGSSTALFDAVGRAITENSPHVDDEETSFVLVVVTDGGENDSRKFKGPAIAKLINKVQKTDRWTITFQVPRGEASSLESLGIPRGNIREWDQDERGIREVGLSTSAGLHSYYDSRSRGLKSVRNFYVETDLSNVTPRQLKRELEDLSSDYGIFSAPREMQIRDFVETKTKKPYYKGQAFYQLVKPETIQANKEILIMDKASTEIYGGQEARDLIGLPLSQNAKVTPGNHLNYEIFVQSTSVNRKLLKGHKVAIRL